MFRTIHKILRDEKQAPAFLVAIALGALAIGIAIAASIIVFFS